MSTLQQKIEALKNNLADVPSQEGGGYFGEDRYFLLAAAAIPVVSFAGLYLGLKPKKDGGKNYKKIFIWTIFLSLILIPLLYFASVNGYLPF